MVVLEAMAAGLPVLAGNVGGLPDLIEPGQTGSALDPLDPLEHPELHRKSHDRSNRSRRGMAGGPNNGLEKFHPKVIASRHLELYQRGCRAPQLRFFFPSLSLAFLYNNADVDQSVFEMLRLTGFGAAGSVAAWRL